VKISQLRTLSTQRVSRKITAASPEQLARVIEGLNELVAE
jgi:mRNA interferase MazF